MRFVVRLGLRERLPVCAFAQQVDAMVIFSGPLVKHLRCKSGLGHAHGVAQLTFVQSRTFLMNAGRQLIGLMVFRSGTVGPVGRRDGALRLLCARPRCGGCLW